jgi:hypothetical protein
VVAAPDVLPDVTGCDWPIGFCIVAAPNGVRCGSVVVSWGRFCGIGTVACPVEPRGSCVRGSTPSGLTGFGTPPVTLGAVCVGAVPPGLTGLGAAGAACCENAGALKQVTANANIAIFLISGVLSCHLWLLREKPISAIPCSLLEVKKKQVPGSLGAYDLYRSGDETGGGANFPKTSRILVSAIKKVEVMNETPGRKSAADLSNCAFARRGKRQLPYLHDNHGNLVRLSVEDLAALQDSS